MVLRFGQYTVIKHNKMSYINKDGKIGTVFQLLPLVSNPQFLSEEELLERGIERYTPEPIEPVVLPLDDYKIQKYENISKQIHEFVTDKYPYYKQLSALSGTYQEEQCKEIIDYCQKYVNMALSIKEAIFSSLNHTEVDLVYFRKYTYSDDDEMKIIDTIFWGSE